MLFRSMQRLFSLHTHRVRGGKLVEIPEEWRGKVTHLQTIRKRGSKTTHKDRLENHKFRSSSMGGLGRKRVEALAPKIEEDWGE